MFFLIYISIIKNYQQISNINDIIWGTIRYKYSTNDRPDVFDNIWDVEILAA